MEKPKEDTPILNPKTVDALRWVAQEARAVILLGYTGPIHERLRKALKALEDAYNEQD
jgi:hypothetical protein